MSTDLKAGDEVICINVDPVPGQGNPEMLRLLTLNATYNVVEVMPHPYFPALMMVLLKEVRLPQGHVAFIAYRFRKVQKPSKGMEILRGLLKTKQKVTEDA